MGNCLLTQLKESVNNSSLEKLGVLRLAVKNVTETSPYYNLLVLSASAETTVTVISDNENDGISETSEGISTPVKSITFTGNKSIYTTNGNFLLEFKSKYNLTKINVNGSGYSSCNIVLSDLDYLLSLSILVAKNQTSSGKLSDLTRLVNLEELDVSSSIITGNIKDVANLIKLTDFRVSYTEIVGDVDEFAAAMVAAGRTSGTMQLHCNPYITWNNVGQTQGKVLYITFDSSVAGGYTVSEINPV